MIKNLKMGLKIGLGFFLVTLILVVIVVVALLQVNRTSTITNQLLSEDQPTAESSLRVLNGVNESLAQLRGWMLLGEEKLKSDRSETWRTQIEPAIDSLVQLVTKTDSVPFDNITAILDKDIKRLTPYEKAMLVKNKLSELKKHQQAIEDIAPTEDNVRALKILKSDAAPVGLTIRQSLESLLNDDLRPRLNQRRDEVVHSAALLETVIWILMIIGVIVSTVIGVWITRSTTRPLAELVGAAAAIADGDLTRPQLTESSNEIGQLGRAFNCMGASLKELLLEVKRMTSELETSSQEINAASQEQVASMTETATSVNEISSTSEEFKATIQEFADRARAVREAAEETAKRATEGMQLTQAASAKNEEVRESFEAAGESILKLSQQMQQITQITTSVNEIAEQTKLLALNASIEAARAGEEGRGFAVVATQVRELANQSKEASSRIASQINEIQGSVQTVIRNSGQGNEKLSDANQMGRKMAEAFQIIAHAIDQTTDAMKQIDQAARQQEAGISDLVTGIAEINAGSRETLATAEQTQQAMAAIEKRASQLTVIMSRFKA